MTPADPAILSAKRKAIQNEFQAHHNTGTVVMGWNITLMLDEIVRLREEVTARYTADVMQAIVERRDAEVWEPTVDAIKAELSAALRVVEAARVWAHQPEGMARSGMRVDELPENALYLATLAWEQTQAKEKKG